MGEKLMFCISDAFIDGDRIRKTIERLNYEWLKKMWKASDDDFRVFWFEQIRKKFEEHED